jgi:hypothetical protein
MGTREQGLLFFGQSYPVKRCYRAKAVILMTFFYYKRERERERDSGESTEQWRNSGVLAAAVGGRGLFSS